MLLRVNPNRMELIRLRRRLVLAKRGHKLLQDKLEDMIRRFLGLIKDVDKIYQEFNLLQRGIVKDLFYCRLVSSKEDFNQAINKVETKISLEVSSSRIMNVKVPIFNLKELTIEKKYSFLNTPAQLDLALAKSRDYLLALIKLAQALKTLELLSQEIERTRRRVNALKYILIPSLEETIRYISQKLNEFERSNIVKLMRVKAMVK